MAKRYLFAICTLALISMSSCKDNPKEPVNNPVATVAAPTSTPTPLVGTEVCGSQDTYTSVKDIVFDEAIKQISGDTVPLNDLKRGVSVTMQFPLVKGINEQLKRTDCSGRLLLGLPPGVTAAFGGERQLKADVIYSVQPAADGNGSVITADGIGFLVQTLVNADATRAMLKVANEGGPQLVKTYNPSFDCGRHLANVERMICQDEALSEKDRRMSAVFKSKLGYYMGAERQSFLSTQRSLLRERANCADLTCLNDWYDKQLKALGE